MSDKKIKIVKNGPYHVTGKVPLKQAAIIPGSDGISESWETGKQYEPGETYFLCRCGRSKKTPFCDGAHMSVKFNGAEIADKTPYAQSAVRRKGPKGELLDREDLCAVARFCDKGKTVWEDILSADEQTFRAAARDACKCPAGRLTVIDANGVALEPSLEKEINLIEDPAKNSKGPIWVKGGIPVESADGASYEARNRVTLCRCGESGNMPYCDASHLACPHMRGDEK